MIDFCSQIFLAFTKGGLVMYPLLACSVIVVAIGIERHLYFRGANTNVEILLETLQHSIQASDWIEAMRICKNTKGIAAAMLAKGLSINATDPSYMEQALEGSATVAVAKLRYHLNYLDTIVTLAPLLGLLGTVTGMMQSFSVLAIKTGQPQAITGGVGEALVATAAGLCVAIMALVFHSYFMHRIDAMVTDMEQVSNFLLDAAMLRFKS